MNLLPFQQNVVEELLNSFVTLWKEEHRQSPLVFKAPTGSGKTFMVTSFIRGLNKLPQWDQDKAFIWITFSDELAMQSKNKYEEYFENNLENNLLTVNDINQGKLEKNDILFINWQKIVSKAAENRLLRRPEEIKLRKEQGKYFEDFIDGTHEKHREIILIVDESHKNTSTKLSQEIIDYINPKIIIKVSATPEEEPSISDVRSNKAGYVEVLRKAVVEEGLIKEKIVTQTKEDLQNISDTDFDEALLSMGMDKRLEIKEEFNALNKKINPLLLIQLPNDDKDLIELGQKTKEQVVLEFLKKNGVKEEQIALWFDGKQKNMEFVTENDSEVNFMLFKQAAGTGWDCPRAHVLVMFREISSSTFYIQTVGRILRMSEPQKSEDYINSPKLRTGYLFTNYSRKDVADSWFDKSSSNKPFVFVSKRKTNIKNIELKSDYIPRVNYGDLSNSAAFQKSFIESFDKYFSISDSDIFDEAPKKLEEKGIDLEFKLTNQVIVDAEITDYEQIGLEFKKEGKELEVEVSHNDIEKTFNYLCYKLLKEQTEDQAKISNIARSWSPLKSALRVWLRKVFGNDSIYFYKVFINDVRKGGSSKFRLAITQAIKNYKPILEELLNKKLEEELNKQSHTFTIRDEYYYTEDCEKHSRDRYVLEDFYIRKEYAGKENETKFIEYIDKLDEIEWWFKNGDSGKEYYSLKYFNTSDEKMSLFYPDWIIRFKNGKIGIFDTKSGITGKNTEGRAEALAQKIAELGKNFTGGIVVPENGIWYANNSVNYSFTPGNLTNDWIPFQESI